MLYLIPQILDRTADRLPEKGAVRCGAQEIGYAELARRANRLARALRERGVRRHDRVGIYLEKGIDAVVAMYGILKAGACYVPLDPMTPVVRLAMMVRDAGIRHLVTQPGRVAALRQLAAAGAGVEVAFGIPGRDDLPLQTVPWEEVWTFDGATPPDVGAMELDLAYILYTSGTTGAPKGMMHTHRGSLTFVEWCDDVFALRAEDRLANHAPLHFDLSIFDFFAGALAGATTVIVPPAHAKLPASLSKLLEEERVTACYMVPAALVQLLLRGVLPARELSALRWVIFGGEAFPTKHLRALMALLPRARFMEVYGVTETNVCHYYEVPPLPEGSDDPIPIGRLCENMDALVVDEEDRPVPPGEAGELLVRAASTMVGYWGRPDLNERAFARLSPIPGYELTFYRTGDLVRRDADGTYWFLGRKDRQVKTRGFRVELDEVEAALLAHPAVDEAAAFTVLDGEGSRRIEAAVVAKAGAAVEAPALVRHAATLLPPYAVPEKIAVMSEFPRTSTDKLDRRRLEALAIAGTPTPARP